MEVLPEVQAQREREGVAALAMSAEGAVDTSAAVADGPKSLEERMARRQRWKERPVKYDLNALVVGDMTKKSSFISEYLFTVAVFALSCFLPCVQLILYSYFPPGPSYTAEPSRRGTPLSAAVFLSLIHI